MMPQLIDPQSALFAIFDYSSRHGMVTLTISASIEQRLNHTGDIAVTPISDAVAELDLLDVELPNWVIAQVKANTTFPISVYRANIYETR